MPQPTQRGGVSMAVRAGIWIVVAVGFLINKVLSIRHHLLQGQPVTNWDVGILLLWSIVLCFWIVGLVWNWKRRSDARKVV